MRSGGLNEMISRVGQVFLFIGAYCGMWAFGVAMYLLFRHDRENKK